MNLFQKYIFVTLLFSLVMSNWAIAQGPATSVNNVTTTTKKWAKDFDYKTKDSIRQEDKMYQISVWRRIDLKEKYNKPFYGLGNNAESGIMKHIRAGVVSGKVRAYSSESLVDSTKIGVEKFKNLFDSTDYKGRMRIQDLYLLDFKEDFVFDRHHSRFKFDIKIIALVKPEMVNKNYNSKDAVGAENTFAYIPYEDLMKYFKDTPDAKWINFNNSAESKSYVEKFEGRAFRSVVKKFTNEFNLTLLDFTTKRYGKFSEEDKKKYGDNWPKLQAFLDAMEFEYKLLDFENSVWEW